MTILWIVFALVTAAVIYALLIPWSRGNVALLAANDPELELYKSQLREIEADQARGLIARDDAQAATLEISRKILKHANSRVAATPGQTAFLDRKYIFAVVGLIVTATSLTIYLFVGSPNLPAQPLQARLNAPLDPTNIEAMVARVEARLRQFPDDGNGWNVIAPVYMRQQRFADAQEAYRKAILLLGETPERLSGYGEAATLANNGVVTPGARLAFEKALASKPDLVMARFWLSAAQEEAGELQAARAGYAHLLTLNLREDWRRGVEEKIAQLDARIAKDTAPAAPMSAEQAAMIEGMVARLAARLDKSGGDLSEWLKLMRAYSVLGRQEEAATTLQKARAANAGNEAALKQLNDFAAELGLRS